MRLSILLLLFAQCVAAIAQETPCIHCVSVTEVCDYPQFDTCCDDASLSTDVQSRLNTRTRNNNFYNTLRMIHPPSILSGGTVTSFTINTLGYDKKNFILDADVRFPISIGGPRFGLNTIHIIPRFKVRIFQDDPDVPFGIKGDTSLPVRTPSTMPGIAWYFSFDKLWNPEASFNSSLKQAIADLEYNSSKERREALRPFRDNKYFGIHIFHHSNGQDGIGIYANDSVNLYNGNYGEQVVFEPIIGGQRKFAINGDFPCRDGKCQKVVDRNKNRDKEAFIKSSRGVVFNWRVSWENHPFSLSNPEFRDLSDYNTRYNMTFPEKSRMIGRNRLNARFSVQMIPKLIEYIVDKDKWCLITPEASYERWRFMADFSYILDRDYYRGPDMLSLEKVGFFGVNRRFNAWFTAFHVLKRSQFTALFAEVGYSGSDRYNIYFNQSLWQIRYGVAFGFFDQHSAVEHRF